jgi:hypothetical protein
LQFCFRHFGELLAVCAIRFELILEGRFAIVKI